MTYEEFVMQEYMPLYRFTPRYQMSQLSFFRRIAFPVIGDLELGAIRPSHTEAILSELCTLNLSDTTVASHYHSMKRAFQLAISQNLIHRDPCTASFIHATNKRFTYPEDIDTHNLIISSIERTPLRNLYGFSYTAGFSIMELRPLRRTDYDAEMQLLTLNTKKHKGSYLISGCALSYLEAELEKREHLSTIENDLLFVTDTGSHIPHTHTRICTHIMRNLLHKPDFTSHDLWMGYGNMLKLTGGYIWP